MPTPNGWGLLVLGAGSRSPRAGALALLEFYVIGATAVAAVVVALAVRLVHPSRLSLRRLVASEMVPVAEPVEVTLQIRNRSRLASPTVRLDEARERRARRPLHPGARCPGASTARRQLPASPDTPGACSRSARRSSATSTVSDWRAGGGSAATEPVWSCIRPSRRWCRPGCPSAGPSRRPVTLTAGRSGSRATSFDVLRPYVEGDDLRHIHLALDGPARRVHGETLPAVAPRSHDSRHRHPGPPVTSEARRTAPPRWPRRSSAPCCVPATRPASSPPTARGTPLLAQWSEVGAALEFLAVLDGGQPGIDVQPIGTGSVVVAVTASPEAIDNAGRPPGTGPASGGLPDNHLRLRSARVGDRGDRSRGRLDPSDRPRSAARLVAGVPIGAPRWCPSWRDFEVMLA